MLRDIELNPQFARALRLMEAGDRHLFITGRAGTGKSTLLEYFRFTTERNIVVLAPTGVAAVNVAGQTIHSFFRFRPDVTAEQVRRQARKKAAPIYKNLETIVIDEISMVRADLLDCVDQFLRVNGKEPGLPFGGIQMIFIGDLYQIPPVVTARERSLFEEYYASEFFFDAKVCENICLEHLELEKIYRQTDQNFIDLLNRIRNKTASGEDINLLNRRVFDPGAELPRDTVYLTTTNAMAVDKNREELAKLPGRSCFFEAEVSGEIDRKSYPAEELLEVKKGAQVMLLNNDPGGRWINGTIGTVVDIDQDSLGVALGDGSSVAVNPFKWNIYRFFWDEAKQAVAADNVGFFKQYPLKLAWAITIHKSQGKTFDRAVIDLGRGTFASGQLYVALSRCRSLEGIYLRRGINEADIRVDYRVVGFTTGRQYALSAARLPLEEKLVVIRDALAKKAELEIVYLKNTGEETMRVVRPESVGKMQYRGKSFPGMVAYCCKRNEVRTFRVDRILEIKKGITGCGTMSCDPAEMDRGNLTGIAGCIDVESCGLSPRFDEIVELALILFRYDDRAITGIVDSYTGLREPGCRISSGALGIHGLTMDDLIGYRLDMERIEEMLEQADFLVAHNANFDRAFVSPMFPAAGRKRWLCSMADISWRGRRGLQELLKKHDIVPGQYHRALSDVEGVLALLARGNSRGETYFAEMLRNSALV